MQRDYSLDVLDGPYGKVNDYPSPGGLSESHLVSCMDLVPKKSSPTSLTVCSPALGARLLGLESGPLAVMHDRYQATLRYVATSRPLRGLLLSVRRCSWDRKGLTISFLQIYGVDIGKLKMPWHHQVPSRNPQP